MGDPMTKILLAISQQYCVEFTGNLISSHVGDDFVAVSNKRR